MSTSYPHPSAGTASRRPRIGVGPRARFRGRHEHDRSGVGARHAGPVAECRAHDRHRRRPRHGRPGAADHHHRAERDRLRPADAGGVRHAGQDQAAARHLVGDVEGRPDADVAPARGREVPRRLSVQRRGRGVLARSPDQRQGQGADRRRIQVDPEHRGGQPDHPGHPPEAPGPQPPAQPLDHDLGDLLAGVGDQGRQHADEHRPPGRHRPVPVHALEQGQRSRLHARRGLLGPEALLQDRQLQGHPGGELARGRAAGRAARHHHEPAGDGPDRACRATRRSRCSRRRATDRSSSPSTSPSRRSTTRRFARRSTTRSTRTRSSRT